MNEQERYQMWVEDERMDATLQQELEAIRSSEEEIHDRFYQYLSFGTAGMRGVRGAGTNRINLTMIHRATAGLALYLLSAYGKDAFQKGVVIAYDSRLDSEAFAQRAALTLNAYGIAAYVFDTLAPTPELSFAVRHLEAVAGIVITASHNPKEYNGYKVYDEQGCQMVDEAMASVAARIDALERLEDLPVLPDLQRAKEQGLYNKVGAKVHRAYQEAVLAQSRLEDGKQKEDLKVVYTPLHGTGLQAVTSVLQAAGFTQVTVVPEQAQPDGNFSTVSVPNPEDAAAFQLAMTLALQQGSDLVLGTDPDCDRVGIAVRKGAEFQTLTGNQTGALLTDYLVETAKEPIDENTMLVKTIVTSELGASIVKAHGGTVEETLTGFKYIGTKMTEYAATGKQFLMGYEESYGYLVGMHARDKDGVVASLLICEMAAYWKQQGKTLLDRLEELYATYGFYLDQVTSYTLPGEDGQQKMEALMETLRTTQRDAWAGLKITQCLDYQMGRDGLPPANVLKYQFATGGWMAVRPSGTEPKIKFYYSLVAEDRVKAEEQLALLQAEVQQLVQS